MASRIGGGSPPPFAPPSGATPDNRLEQMREQQLKALIEQRSVRTRDEGEHVLASVMKGLKNREIGPAAPVLGELARLVAEFQRQNGLPATGRLDSATLVALRDNGVLPPAVSNPAPREPARPGREDVAAARQTRAAAEQRTKQRVGDGAQTPDPPNTVDRVADPARLLASLVTAGFAGKAGLAGLAGMEEALKMFQSAQGLPVTGKLDQQTQETLKKAGIEADTPAKSDKPVEPKQQVRRALTETSKHVADREMNRDPLRPQASTQQQTTSADVAARAPVTSSSDAVASARLDTVVAQQAATERGVQEGTGDPQATQGHGEVAGIGAGQKGAGGVSGGGSEGHGPGARAVDGPPGEETAVGNAEAGDDDFNDDGRGNANMQGDQEGGEFWQVPPLSLQVHAALEAIVRDDDGSGPVTYTWDVTFMQPGTYAAGQPAPELWHVAVKQATAFDPVWQQAADAVSSRMLYGEPDADPPTIDDFIMALRRARVR